MTRHQNQQVIAADTLEEVIGFIETCLATGEPTAVLRDTVLTTNKGLRMISDHLRRGDIQDRETVTSFAESATAALAHLESAENPAVSGQGHSMAAAMLRLARAVTRRALRALEAVHGLDIAVLDYVGMLPRLLDNLADTLDLDDQSAIPVGLCAEPAHRR